MKDTLKQLAKRGLSLNGYDYEGGLYLNPGSDRRVSVDAQNREYLLTLASAETDLRAKDSDTDVVKAAKADALATVRAAMAGDAKALRSLNALRLTQSDNYIKASSNFMSFFEVVTLKDDERPGVKYTSQNEISCGYVAQDGSPRRVKIEPHRDHATIPLRHITSNKVGYYTRDIYDGSNIADMARATFDIAFDLSYKIDRECFTLLNAAVGSGGVFGAFTVNGAKANRLYVPHSGIITSHLPDTNDITVHETAISSDGTVYNDATSPIVGRFGVRVIQEIIRYAESWGQWSPQGQLVPTGEIIVPSSDIFAIMLDHSVISTSAGRPTESDLERDMAEKGFMEINYGGRTWRFVRDVTIESGTCFPKFNKVPGQVFLKPSQDREFTKTDEEANWEERSQQKVFGAYVLNHWRMNALRLTYKE